MERKGKYLYSKPGEKGLVMTFEYRGKTYSVIRAFTYPEYEGDQHRKEQERIDSEIEHEEYLKAHPQSPDSCKIPQSFWDLISNK